VGSHRDDAKAAFRAAWVPAVGAPVLGISEPNDETGK
jgi:hypothetical protein